MYGQFHTFHTNEAKKFTTGNHEVDHSISITIPKKSLILFFTIILVGCLASTNSFAGPKQPKLTGGNGNANGR